MQPSTGVSLLNSETPYRPYSTWLAVQEFHCSTAKLFTQSRLLCTDVQQNHLLRNKNQRTSINNSTISIATIAIKILVCSSQLSSYFNTSSITTNLYFSTSLSVFGKYPKLLRSVQFIIPNISLLLFVLRLHFRFRFRFRFFAIAIIDFSATP